MMTSQNNNSKTTATATVGGGCFWCTEAVYQELTGIISVVSGYAGGHVTNPTYRQVTSGTTGHAEVVQLKFDPELVSYREILEVFFATHDPTTLNRQGNDVGTQYRSIVLFHDEEQKTVAEDLIQELNSAAIFSGTIVTQVEPLDVFYEAEDYHQNYFRNNPYQPYCQVVINPKLAKFRSKFATKLAQP